MLAHQDKLPILPLPSVEETTQRYLAQIEPLVSPEVLKEARAHVAEFVGSTTASVLQAHLSDQRARVPNWLSRLWSDAYLCDRSPPGLHVSPSLGFDPKAVAIPLSRDPIAVAAEICVVATAMQRAIAARTIPVDKVRGNALCMEDYDYFLGCVRIPVVGRDAVVRAAPASPYWHCVVMCRGHIFELPLCTPSWTPTSESLRRSLRQIRREAEAMAPATTGALTYLDRDDWAKTRGHMMASASLRFALHRVETALFVLTLDDVSPPDDSAETAHALMHGHTAEAARAGNWHHLNRWWDKSIHLHVALNGAAGITFEHSAMDSLPVLALARALADHVRETKTVAANATADGGGGGPAPRHVPFAENEVVKAAIQRGAARLRASLISLNLDLFAHSYPTQQLRALGISPDGVVQACLHVAFCRTRGQPPSTYESAATKTFLNGRTETLRPHTTAMQRFAALLLSQENPDPHCIVASLKAVGQQHNALARAASQGLGCDRHLLGLLCAAEELGLPTPRFISDEAYRIFKTITLSTTHPFWNPGCRSVSFGPVISPLCVGAGYFVAPHDVTVGISTWRQNPSDDASQRFRRHFIAALGVVIAALGTAPSPTAARTTVDSKAKL